MKIIKMVLVLCSIAMTPVINAALITETWLAEFSTNTLGNGYLAGEQFSWQITYDNASESMTFFSDGIDGVGNTSDDIVEGVAQYGEEFSADVLSSSSFSNVIERLLTGAKSAIPFNLTLVDYFSAYNDFRWGETSQNQYVKTFDYYQVVANFEENNKSGNIQYHLNIEGHGVHNFYESFNVISVTSSKVKVNEPSSVALFTTCFLLLMILRRRIYSN